MTEAEKRAKVLAFQAELGAASPSSRAASIISDTTAATKAAVDHTLEVASTYNAMSKNGITVDDLIDAYNRASQDALDFSISFFFSAYAIALHEHGRDVLDALNSCPMPEKKGGFPVSGTMLDEMARRGITKRDVQRFERLGAKKTEQEMGLERFIEVIKSIEDEDLVERVQEIMDEEIVAADIMERCKIETGVDVKALLGIE